MSQTYTGTGSSDADFMTDEYRVTKGSTGANYENGEFVYGVQAWYNPVTNQIFTEDIDQAGGGRIYLTGAIANTNANGGKLVVLDGGSNYELKVRSIILTTLPLSLAALMPILLKDRLLLTIPAAARPLLLYIPIISRTKINWKE